MHILPQMTSGIASFNKATKVSICTNLLCEHGSAFMCNEM